MEEKGDVISALEEIYGGRVSEYAKNDPNFAKLTGEDFVIYHQEDPTCQSSYWGREGNLRTIATRIVETDGLSQPEILCAACGSGAEPLELALRLASQGLSFQIDGFDVSPQVLHKARDGVIRGVSGIHLKDLEPLEKLSLISCVDGKAVVEHNMYLDYVDVNVDPSVLAHVNFSQHDIIDRPFPRLNKDIIVCNNLLQHYPKHTRSLILIHLLRSLKDGGVLALEHDEMLGGLGFTPERFAWLAPYYEWKKDLSEFGLSLMPGFFPSQRLYRYSRNQDIYASGDYALRNGELVRVPEH